MTQLIPPGEALCDRFGVPLSCRDPQAVGRFDAAVAKLLIFNNDPIAEADAALAVDASLPMAHLLKGMLYALSTEKALLPLATASLAAANAALEASAAPASVLRRERRHAAALEAWIHGRPHAAAALWEDVLIDEPRDALAMFAAHQTDFFTGNALELRDRTARRLRSIESGSALAGYYRGMHAFGLEETGDYAQAEEAGRAAVAADPRDAWAVHAVAHVCEMTNRVEDGQRWLRERIPDWASNNFLAVHNWWHLALFFCEQRRWPEVLELYDARIRDGESTVIMNMLDASSLLWRLMLWGVDVGNRWHRLARAWEPRLEDGWYAFNDLHAMMAFAGAGRDDLSTRLLDVMQEAADRGGGENAAVTREVGLPAARAFLAFAEGRYAPAVDGLLPVAAQARSAGGSHAQRDVIDLTLAMAADKSGRKRLARALVGDRLARKPDSRLDGAWRNRLASEAS